MQHCRLGLEIDSTDHSVPLAAEVWLNNKKLWHTAQVDHSYEIQHEFPDNDSHYELRICLLNKTTAHTTIDDQGQIIKDVVLTVKNIRFDQVNIDYIFSQQAVYTHNHNSTTDTIQDKFHGQMGCNGTVSLKFRAPVYVWLLENM